MEAVHDHQQDKAEDKQCQRGLIRTRVIRGLNAIVNVNGTVRVTPGIFPPTMSTTPNSPMVCAKDSAAPVTSPGTESGAITRKNVRTEEAPRVAEAAMSLRSTLAKDVEKGCTAKGRL